MLILKCYSLRVAKIRALVVDDEPAILELIKMILERHGYDVTAAESGNSALKAFAGQDPFDFLLTDITMPDMDGWELLRELARNQIHIPVVLMSGYAAERGDGRQESNRAILRKPFSPQELLAAVEMARLTRTTASLKLTVAQSCGGSKLWWTSN